MKILQENYVEMREKYDNNASTCISACKITVTVLMQDINADMQYSNPFRKSNLKIKE